MKTEHRKSFSWRLQPLFSEPPLRLHKLRSRLWLLLQFDSDGKLTLDGVRESGFVHVISSVGEDPVVLASGFAPATRGLSIPVARKSPVAVGFDVWSKRNWLAGTFVTGDATASAFVRGDATTRDRGGAFDFPGCRTYVVSRDVVYFEPVVVW